MEEPVISQEVEVLTDLGLTSCQAKVYLCLCHSGSLDAKTISKHTSIARQDIYRITTNLETLGLIETIIFRPTLFRALPIEKGVKFLLNRKQKELNETETKTKTLLKNFEEHNTTTLIAEKQKFVFVSGKEALIDKITESTKNTQNTIDSVNSYERLSNIFIFSEALEKAWSRGVKCRFIMNKPEQDAAAKKVLDFLTKHPNCQVKFIPRAPETVMTLHDQKEIFLFTNPNARMAESPALWSNNPSLISGMRDYFTIQWITALDKPEYITDDGQV